MQSKQGATSANTQKAKGGCLQHNRRTQTAANVDPSRSHLNTSWEHDRIKNLASTRSLIRRAEKLYTEKTRQKCQAAFAPLKETCVVCKGSTTMEDAMKIARKVEEQTGVVCLGIWIHRDEGHARSRFSPDEPYQCNNHLHILWDCQDHETGKAIPIKRQHLRDMQDIAADALGMERGNPAELTKRRHIDSMTYKAQALAKELKDIEKEKRETTERMKSEVREMEGQIAELGKAKAVKEQAVESAKERVKEFFAGNDKKRIKQLEGENAALKDNLAEREARIAQERKNAIATAEQAKNNLVLLNAEHNRELKEMEARAKDAEASAKKYTEIINSFWPGAMEAIHAIVERCTTVARAFTMEQVMAIRRALAVYTNKEYAISKLWEAARILFPTNTYKEWIQEGKEDYLRIARADDSKASLEQDTGIRR